MAKKQKSVRALAFETLFTFEKTLQRLDVLTERVLQRPDLKARDRRFFKNLVYSVVRHRLYLDWVGEQLFTGRYKKLLLKFKILLRMALYELLYMKAIPAHATVDEYVELAKKRLDVQHSKMMNGLLRNYLRKKPALDPDAVFSDPVERLSVKYSFPKWMIKRWLGFWDVAEVEALCKKLNEPPDFDVHINTKKISVNAFKKLLRSKIVPFEETAYDPQTIRVKDLQPFIRERWFEKGYCVVQDEGAALVAEQLQISENDVVLDMCAAPGGKYVQLLKRKPQGGTIVAMDIDLSRLKRVKQNVERLGLEGGLFVVADGRHLPFKKVFTRILLDAPCSGLGVIRKHPDIKWRRTLEEIVEFSRLQNQLLEGAQEVLRKDGQLVYSTCTIDYLENENVANNFLEQKGTAFKVLAPEGVNEEMVEKGFVRIQPHRHGMDGSFFVRFKKTAD